MDLLKYKTVNAVAGALTIHPGLNRDQIIRIARQGIQFDYTSLIGLSASNSCWSFISHTKKIIFKDAFATGEKIHIIYKVTL